MKFKVFEKNREEGEVYFKLHEGADGSIFLSALDKEGKLISGILKITTDGTLVRGQYISEKTGLSLDAAGRVNLSEEE